MQTHQLKRNTRYQKKKTVGRGGKRGTTSGRGTKGQKARAGHRMRPELRDIIKKLPKQRGYHFQSFGEQAATVSLGAIAAQFAAGDIISPKALADKGLIPRVAGRLPAVKILGGAAVKAKFTIQGCTVSASVREAVVAAGGAVQ